MNVTNHRCESPREHNEPAPEWPQSEPADFRFWRRYVYTHLAITLVAATVSLSDAYGNWLFEEGDLWTSDVYMGLIVVALSGLVFLWTLPFVLIILTYCGWYGDSRYLFIAFVEVLISAAYVYVLLPEVQ